MTRSDFGSRAEYASDAEYVRANEVEPDFRREDAVGRVRASFRASSEKGLGYEVALRLALLEELARD